MLKKNINIDFVTCFHVNKDINVKVHLHLYNIFTAQSRQNQKLVTVLGTQKRCRKKVHYSHFSLIAQIIYRKQARKDN